MSLAPQALIVGAGIVGAACAEALARSGWRVRVLERSRAAGAATAAGMGHVLVLDDSQPQLELTRLSRTLWDERAEQWPKHVEREACGTIWVAADEEELRAAAQKLLCYRQHFVECELLDEEELYRHEPNLRRGMAGGLRIPGDSVVYPPAATATLLEWARLSGAVVEEECAVARCGNGYVKLADGRQLEADLVIAAAGLDTPSLVDFPALQLRAKKGHLAITDRAPGFVRHQLVELGYLKSAHGTAQNSVAFNAQPRATGQILLGSSRQWDNLDSRVEEGILSQMLERAFTYLPGLCAHPVVRTWVGFRPATQDNLPFIGPLPGQDRLWIAAGHEGLGITTSLGTAQLLCDQILGNSPPIDPAPFWLERLEGASGHE